MARRRTSSSSRRWPAESSGSLCCHLRLEGEADEDELMTIPLLPTAAAAPSFYAAALVRRAAVAAASFAAADIAAFASYKVNLQLLRLVLSSYEVVTTPIFSYSSTSLNSQSAIVAYRSVCFLLFFYLLTVGQSPTGGRFFIFFFHTRFCSGKKMRFSPRSKHKQ